MSDEQDGAEVERWDKFEPGDDFAVAVGLEVNDE